MKGKQIYGVYLYGLDREYQIIRYSYVPGEALSVGELIRAATGLRVSYPSIQYVYAVDNGHDLYQEYLNVIRRRSLENRVLFKIMLEERGISIA